MAVKAAGAKKVGDSEDMRVVLQVGSEFRVSNNGEVVLDNPELELSQDTRAADATLMYRFDAAKGEHIFRLVEPVADHAHAKAHRTND